MTDMGPIKSPGTSRKNQEGFALVLSLILLLLCTMVITPLLGYMSTGFNTGQDAQKKADELYAADAGVKEAIWNIRNDTNLPPAGGTTGQGGVPALPLIESNVAGKTVSVTIFCRAKGVAGGTYKVTSVAMSAGGSSKTTIEAWIDFEPGFWDYAVVSTSNGSIYLADDSVIDGKVAGDLTGPSGIPAGTVNGAVDDPWDPARWPFGGVDFRTYFNTPDLIPYASNKLDLVAPSTFGSIYRNGNLAINNIGTADATAALNGTLYVAGANSSLLIGQSNQSFVLNMGTNSSGYYNSIYAEGGDNLTSSQFAIDVGPKTTITGSGVIMAEGNINFQPNIVSGPGDFLFIMSLNGYVNFHPSGTFYGSVAGYTGVELAPSTNIVHTEPPLDLLNFPAGPSSYNRALIRSWKVIPPLTTANIGLNFNTRSLPGGSVDVAYSQMLVASGGTTPYTWAVSAGSLPPGLTLNTSTGAVTGTPTTVGAYPFTARVTDSASPSPATLTRSLSIAVWTALAVTTASLPDGAPTQAYGAAGGIPATPVALEATGGTVPYSWSISSGALPPGLVLDPTTGAITGTPTTGGAYPFTVQVTDSASPTPAIATQALSIRIGLCITTASPLPNGKKNKLYGDPGPPPGVPNAPVYMAATGGTTPYTWSIVSGAPPGMSINGSTGQLTGTPTTAGTYSSFVIGVTDSLANTAIKTFTITIAN